MTPTSAINEHTTVRAIDNLKRKVAPGIRTLDTPFFRAKYLSDRLLAAMLLIPALPLITLLIVMIRLSSRGPGIYAQSRVGCGGKVFTMYKLRSMRCDAEAKSGPVWSNDKQDSRVTPLGHWLRKLHLDELPQLYNVVLGQMALVGPRPERPEFVEVLIQKLPSYADRLQIAPGITGLAQINLPPDSDLNSVRRKLLLDCEYIATANAWLDLCILIATVLRLFGLRGGRATRWLSVQRIVPLSSDENPPTPTPVHPLHLSHASTSVESSEVQKQDGRLPVACPQSY